MGNNIVGMLKHYVQDRSEEEIREIAARFGTAQMLDDLIAVRDEYKLSFSDEDCNRIFTALHNDSNDVSDEDLETVTGGCESTDCHP